MLAKLCLFGKGFGFFHSSSTCLTVPAPAERIPLIVFSLLRMDQQAMWQAALGELELSLSKAAFTAWFKHTYIGSSDNVHVIVCVPNSITKDYIEKKYHDAILKALRNASSGTVRDVRYRVETRSGSVPEPLPPVPSFYPQTQQTPLSVQPLTPTLGDQTQPWAELGLNPRYTFSTFVVGKSNELAHAACMAISGRPGDVYNPLFLYGGAGMGKTHLLQAIGHHLAHERPGTKIRYVTSERFTNEFITSVRSGKANDFKEAYRTVDILLIDDIQFLTGKEGTQEEFFHTFNTLHQNNKQIVIASDRPPKDIAVLESRLLSRFEWGMMVDISRPDFETRVAILEAKTREKSYPLATELLHAIAGSIQSNIRELEGALNKIIAYHQFKNILPSVGTVEPLLQSFAPTIQKRSLTPRHLLELICTHYELSMDDLIGKSRERRFALPRQIAMYLLREELKCSFPTIGDHLGSRDHTTAMHACEKIHELVKSDDRMKRDLAHLREKMYSSSG